MGDKNLTDILVDYVCDTTYEDITEDAIDRAKIRLLDSIGVMAIGRTSPDANATVEMLRNAGGSKEATVATYGFKIPMAQAAFANSLLMRSYDFEAIDAEGLKDGEPNVAAHISGTTVPAALAVAEAAHASGKEFLRALILGDDVVARALGATGFSVFDNFDGNGTANVLGAVVAAGLLLGLSKEEMKGAFSLGVNQMSGTMQNVFEKKITFKVPIALSARAGIFAAQLARCDYGTCLDDPIAGPRGMFEIFYNDPKPERMTINLGKRFYADAVIKPWPACRATHASVNATLLACKGRTFNADQIDAIELHVPDYTKNFVGQGFEFGMDHSYQGAFSIDFLCATAILRGDVKPEFMQPKMMVDPELGAILDKLEIVEDQSCDSDAGGAMTLIKLANGDVLQGSTDFALGEYRHTPLSYEDILKKYYSNIEFGGTISKDYADCVVDTVSGLNDVADMAELVALIA